MVDLTINPGTFVVRFFGSGNSALPNADLDGPRGPRVRQYLAPLLAGVQRPMILPRTHEGRTDAYVVAWNPAEAAQVRRLIEAFVGHSLVPFDGRSSRLRGDDPVEAAVIDLFGRNTTFVLRAGSGSAAQQALWRRLAILRDLLNSRPGRTRAIPRPAGRVLADFRAAVASGAAQTSAVLLDELTDVGGVSPLNLAYLSAHRLGKLGRSGELLRMPAFDDVVASRPPMVVAEAILGAWAQVEFGTADLVSAADVERTVAAAGRRADTMATLCSHVDLTAFGVRMAAALVCLVREDKVLARRLLPVDDIPSAVAGAITNLITSTQRQQSSSEPTDINGVPEPPDVLRVAPTSWVDIVRRLGVDISDALTLSVEWSRWPSPAEEDAQLASALGEIVDNQAEAAWGVVGPFLEADVFEAPAWRSAEVFLFQAAAYDRWAPADLASVQALLEVFTRGAPPASAYTDTLDLVGGTTTRWASVANVERTLDIVDVLARAACPDAEARLRFSTTALEPLHRGRWRLDPPTLWLVRQVGAEIGLDWDWTSEQGVPPPTEETKSLYGNLTVLVYSLNPGALQRAVDGLVNLAPNLRIHSSSHKAGTDQLRAQARSADAVALATRSATHAATGFIRQHARAEAVVREADGAGSATLLRAAVSALDDACRRRTA